MRHPVLLILVSGIAFTIWVSVPVFLFFLSIILLSEGNIIAAALLWGAIVGFVVMSDLTIQEVRQWKTRDLP